MPTASPPRMVLGLSTWVLIVALLVLLVTLAASLN
jgi:hypothetical protein